jgi:O-antigen/teichoic acid export membrane protein
MDASAPDPEVAPDRPAPASDAQPAAEGKPAAASVTIAKNSAWLLLDNGASLVTQFYCSILVARALGPDRMGDYNYVMWFAAILKMLSDVAIPATFRKFAAEFMGRGDYATVKTMVRRIFRLQIVLATLGAAIGLAIVHLTFRPEQRALGTLAVLTIVPALLLGVPAGFLYGTEDLRYNVTGSVTAMAVNLAGVTVAVLTHQGLIGILGALLISRVADCGLRYFMLWRLSRKMPGKAHDRLDPALRKRLIQFAALQMVPSVLYFLVFDRTEVAFLKPLAASREIAFFSITFTLTNQLLMLPNTLANSASVSMMVRQGRAPAETARIAGAATWFTILLGAPILLGMAAVGSSLVPLMYGQQYIPAVPVLTTLCFFALGLAASQPAQYLLVAAERQVFYVAWLLVAGGIDALGCFLLIPAHGAVGAAIAKGISQIIAAAGFMAFMVVKFKVRLPVARIMKLLGVCLVMYGAVHLLVLRLPRLPGVIVGIPLGMTIFVLLMRALRCLDKADRDRLRGLDRMLPGRARAPYRKVINFLVPVAPVAAAS